MTTEQLEIHPKWTYRAVGPNYWTPAKLVNGGEDVYSDESYITRSSDRCATDWWVEADVEPNVIQSHPLGCNQKHLSFLSNLGAALTCTIAVHSSDFRRPSESETKVMKMAHEIIFTIP